MPDNRPTDEQMPDDPMNILEQDATALHEMYSSYVSAGFTEDQAMRICLQSHQTLLQLKIGMLLSQGVNPFGNGGQ